jgi:hypothetical protein
MKMPKKIDTLFLAPCGIDCAVCYARLRERSPCPGCLSPEAGQPKHCRSCAIKACAKERDLNRCYGCADFPCSNIRRIDRRYLTSYGVGLIENGMAAKRGGLRAFMESERRRWACPACEGVVDQHRRRCSECGEEYPLERGA